MIDIQLFQLLDYASSKLVTPINHQIKILCLGFPSVMLPGEFSANKNLTPRLPNNNIEANLLKASQHNGYNLNFYSFEDALAYLFPERSYTFELLDIHPNQYPGIVWDLNKEIPYNYYGKYDIILDSGSLEHCFNIGTGFQNIARMVSTHGVIISAIPYFSPHHGYPQPLPPPISAWHD